MKIEKDLLFGVTFYPDNWPQAYLAGAWTQIAAAGFNAVRFGEMSWGNIEVSEGHFDFAIFDEALKGAADCNLKVVFGLGVAAAPQWAIRKYPEIRAQDQNGTLTPEYGPRPNLCRDSEVFLKLAKRYVRAVVERYKDHPAICAWQIDNEPTYPPLDATANQDFCHCEATRDCFVAWAKKKYKTLAELNAAWGTFFWGATFSSFADISTPKCGFWDAGNPHIYLDWFRFKAERLNTGLRELYQELKKIDPQHPAGTNNFVGLCNRVPDHEVVAQGMDWYGWDIYPKGTDNTVESFAENADIWRGVCEATGSEFIVAEMQGGNNVRWGNPQAVSGREIISWTHQAVAHGAQGILYHAFRPARVGSETGGFGILSQNGEAGERLEAIKKVGAEVKRFYARLTGFKIKSDVAIVFLKSAEIETYQEEGPARTLPPGWFAGRGELGLFHTLNSIAGGFGVCFGRGLSPRFLFERQLEKTDIKEKVLLLPNPYVLSEKAFEKIYNFVKAGGILITEARFGAKDENAHLRELPLLCTLLEAKFERSEILSRPLKLSKFGAAASGFRDIIRVKRGVIAHFADGEAAIIERKLGRGKIIFACYSLFQSLLAWENRKLLAYIKKQLPPLNITVKGSEAVEWVRWEQSDNQRTKTSELLYLINHSDVSVKVQISCAARSVKRLALAPRAAQLVSHNF